MSSLSCRISTVKVKSGLVSDPSLCVLQTVQDHVKQGVKPVTTRARSEGKAEWVQ